jgi:hypothetical protein
VRGGAGAKEVMEPQALASAADVCIVRVSERRFNEALVVFTGLTLEFRRSKEAHLACFASRRYLTPCSQPLEAAVKTAS